ncbi:hypothetical protein GCM10027073_35640 [Streptomyces chlorus]|uniref:Substrate-binding domain-containing protein n=1 Tax=Streptomyces chlorus TaxID=887452 RepID=A0ABW1E109_9ACTN
MDDRGFRRRPLLQVGGVVPHGTPSAAVLRLCDELGLMVWQDFLFACASYPEEQPLRGEVEAEARDNVVRLMPHPGLVLWNGNNENLWGFRDWEWEPALRGDSWGGGYYLDLLPRVVAELDPTRPYTAGSPWSGSWDHHPNDPAHGTHHSWEVWNRRDYAEYRDSVPRFVAEFGWQAPPALATLRRALPGERLAPDSLGMLHHQKAEDGNGKLDRGLARHFTPPEDDFDRWHYLTQVVQARAVAGGIEHWRSHWPVCAGTVVWQLNDCWPVSSWSAVDGDSRLKPLYHELRRVYADRLLTLQPGADGDTDRPVLAVINQSAEPWHTSVSLRRMRADGTVLVEQVLDLTVPAVAEAVRYLAALGHRRIARVCGPAGLGHSAIRAEAFDRTLAELGLHGGRHVETGFSGEEGARATRTLLLTPDRPTAIVYDIMAVAGLGVAAERGVSVPDDLSLLAWDDSQLCRLTHPTLSAMSHDVHRFGAEVTEVLFDVIAGEKVRPRPVATPSLVPRRSTAPPRA